MQLYNLFETGDMGNNYDMYTTRKYKEQNLNQELADTALAWAVFLILKLSVKCNKKLRRTSVSWKLKFWQ